MAGHRSEKKELYKMPNEYFDDNRVFIPAFPKEARDKVKTLDTTTDDVLVATYPKSGTTWTQQILAQLYPDLCPRDVPIMQSIPFIEHFPVNVPGNPIEKFESKPSPRLFKTHLPASYFQRQVESDQLKVIFVVRNVKDALVSYLHHYKLFEGFGPFDGTWDDFFDLFKAKRLLHHDFFEVVEGWLRLCTRPNVLLVRYEDMKDDLVREIKRIAQFCGRVHSEQEIEAMASRCTFTAMKVNPNANYSNVPMSNNGSFIRKGAVGEWKQYFSDEQCAYVDEQAKKCIEYMALYAD